MDIDVFTAGEMPCVLRVLRTALNPYGPLDEPEQRFLAAYARICGHPLPADLAPIASNEARGGGAHRRKRLLQLAAMAALLHQPVRFESVVWLYALARRLGVHDPVLDALTALVRGRRRWVRVLTMRRLFRVTLKEAAMAEGWRGVVRLFAALLLRAPVNRDRLAGYKRLGLLPEGTLGREYWAHMTRQGFGFPGEPGGIPSSVVYHDIGHVLTGHATTGAGEIQQGCFQGGNRREDGFVFIQFVLLHFHQGVAITPAGPPETGCFDPERVLWAIHRGASCPVDITHQWNFWPLMDLPLSEAQSRCGLLPPLAAA